MPACVPLVVRMGRSSGMVLPAFTCPGAGPGDSREIRFYHRARLTERLSARRLGLIVASSPQVGSRAEPQGGQRQDEEREQLGRCHDGHNAPSRRIAPPCRNMAAAIQIIVKPVRANILTAPSAELNDTHGARQPMAAAVVESRSRAAACSFTRSLCTWFGIAGFGVVGGGVVGGGVVGGRRSTRRAAAALPRLQPPRWSIFRKLASALACIPSRWKIPHPSRPCPGDPSPARSAGDAGEDR